ncbi:hypothetical protein OENI_30117 [Oenococcus oeni]|nr:hypothetical protein OENI_30117 [Oenococcus oeni]
MITKIPMIAVSNDFAPNFNHKKHAVNSSPKMKYLSKSYHLFSF